MSCPGAALASASVGRSCGKQPSQRGVPSRTLDEGQVYPGTIVELTDAGPLVLIGPANHLAVWSKPDGFGPAYEERQGSMLLYESYLPT
jgi:hypothetical protein